MKPQQSLAALLISVGTALLSRQNSLFGNEFRSSLSDHLLGIMSECGELGMESLEHAAQEWIKAGGPAVSGMTRADIDSAIADAQARFGELGRGSAQTQESSPWPLGINPEADAAAAAAGFPEWSCFDPGKTGGSWVRRDGRVVYGSVDSGDFRFLSGYGPIGAPRDIRRSSVGIIIGPALPPDPATQKTAADAFCAEFDDMCARRGYRRRLVWETLDDGQIGGFVGNDRAGKIGMFLLIPDNTEGQGFYALSGAVIPDSEDGRSYPLEAAKRAAEVYMYSWVSKNTLGWRD